MTIAFAKDEICFFFSCFARLFGFDVTTQMLQNSVTRSMLIIR